MTLSLSQIDIRVLAGVPLAIFSIIALWAAYRMLGKTGIICRIFGHKETQFLWPWQRTDNKKGKLLCVNGMVFCCRCGRRRVKGEGEIIRYKKGKILSMTKCPYRRGYYVGGIGCIPQNYGQAATARGGCEYGVAFDERQRIVDCVFLAETIDEEL